MRKQFLTLADCAVMSRVRHLCASVGSVQNHPPRDVAIPNRANPTEPNRFSSENQASLLEGKGWLHIPSTAADKESEKPIVTSIQTQGSRKRQRKKLTGKRRNKGGGNPKKSEFVFVSSQLIMTPKDIKQLRAHTQLSQEKLAQLVGTSWVTISRWERRQASPGGEAETRLSRLAKLVAQIGDALPPQGIYEFLITPHPEFHGHKPAELLSSDYAFRDLVAFVDSAKSGDMA